MPADFTSAASKGEIRTLEELRARAAQQGLYLDESNMLHKVANAINYKPRGRIEEAEEQERKDTETGASAPAAPTLKVAVTWRRPAAAAQLAEEDPSEVAREGVEVATSTLTHGKQLLWCEGDGGLQKVFESFRMPGMRNATANETALPGAHVLALDEPHDLFEDEGSLSDAPSISKVVGGESETEKEGEEELPMASKRRKLAVPMRERCGCDKGVPRDLLSKLDTKKALAVAAVISTLAQVLSLVDNGASICYYHARWLGSKLGLKVRLLNEEAMWSALRLIYRNRKQLGVLKTDRSTYSLFRAINRPPRPSDQYCQLLSLIKTCYFSGCSLA